MIVLGIDPGSVKAGYAFLEVKGRTVKYLTSGVLRFNNKENFLERLEEIRLKTQNLFEIYTPDEIALESLIYVKSPTALIKLAQARGVMLSCFTPTHTGNIFEYSPNLVKSSTTGHGHADKLSVQKTIKMLLGVEEVAADDESDAIAVALCHYLNNGKKVQTSKTGGTSRSLKNALAHKISKELR